MVVEPLLGLSRHARKRLLSALARGEIGPPYSEASLVAALGGDGAQPAIAEALTELDERGVTPEAVGLILESAEAASRTHVAPDLVWTGPEVDGLHARDTRRVYEELLGGVERSLWVSTYAFFDGPRAFRIIAERMDDLPDLQVTLLLNVQRRPGDTRKPGDLVQAFARKLWTEEWPGERRPSAFYDPRSLESEGPGVVLHAKAVVADDDAVFVTSANLTEAAFDRNIEVGMLTRSRVLAESLARHFQVLIEQKLLHALPQA